MDALYVDGLTKSFGGEKALDDVGFGVAAGEIHGLVGRNGSGKSTLIKILSGYHAPDSWRAFSVAGKSIELPLVPGRSASLGLTFVHQDLGLIPELSVLENLRVSRYKARSLGRIRWKNERATVNSLLRQFDIDVSMDSPIAVLAPVDRALIAIIRALADTEGHSGGTLVLDEPTSFLPKDGVMRLFDGMRHVANAGLGVVFVSHRLEEVRSITDRVSILRDGKMVGTVVSANIEEADLIEMMLGQRVEESFPAGATISGDVAFSVAGLQGSYVHDLSFQVRRGEILGLTGLAGMGHSEVVHLLFGSTAGTAGTISLGGNQHSVASMTPSKSMAEGIALLPADRLVASGVGGLPVANNVSLPVLGTFFLRGRLNRTKEVAAVSAMLEALDVRPPEPSRRLDSLSGGNQQKALLGKWLQTKPKVMFLDEPSQGVDVGARKEIFIRIRKMATEGAAVIISSTDYGDLAHVCDRVLVFRYGKVVAEATGDALAEDKLVELSYSSEGALA